MEEKLNYKKEGLRRMKKRKQIRNDKFRKMVSEANERGMPFSGAKYGSWPDSNSPTGYSQRCSYEAYGTCQSPCNGDC